MALKHIKSKILSVKKTSTVTRAMEAVSAVKMRKAQERALDGRPYAAAALAILERVAGAVDLRAHPLTQPRMGKTAFIIITSDKGLAGALNSAVIRAVERFLVERALPREDIVIVGIGRRGADYFANRGYEVRARYENVSDGVSETDARAMTDQILSWHTSGEVAACFIAFQNFLSTFEQKPIIHQIIPVATKTVRDIVLGILPVRGRFVGVANKDLKPVANYTVEPSPEVVLRELLPRLLNIALFHGLLEAKASEHSARMVAMKNATDKAKEMARDLTRKFNKVRQAAITREVSEITSGIEAMR